MHVDVTMGNLKGRTLSYGNWPRLIIPGDHVASIPEYPQSISLARSELPADPRVPAARMTRELLIRFKWDLSLDTIRNLQSDIDR